MNGSGSDDELRVCEGYIVLINVHAMQANAENKTIKRSNCDCAALQLEGRPGIQIS